MDRVRGIFKKIKKVATPVKFYNKAPVKDKIVYEKMLISEKKRVRKIKKEKSKLEMKCKKLEVRNKMTEKWIKSLQEEMERLHGCLECNYDYLGAL